VIHGGREYFENIRLIGPSGDQGASPEVRERSRAWFRVDLKALVSGQQ
jgi:hypothetical protein